MLSHLPGEHSGGQTGVSRGALVDLTTGGGSWGWRHKHRLAVHRPQKCWQHPKDVTVGPLVMCVPLQSLFPVHLNLIPNCLPVLRPAAQPVSSST